MSGAPSAYHRSECISDLHKSLANSRCSTSLFCFQRVPDIIESIKSDSTLHLSSFYTRSLVSKDSATNGIRISSLEMEKIVLKRMQYIFTIDV